ncbi:MAG: bifunctional precorrin-2 dehydrogenase/sirohydrochlorin ferrochelatase [Deltaproteobacteria bacterium]|nr:bifunctional precorrin-2 dehydrogenase/sirohydrochlorin ferrochelatase [Deltaproteobacteria bacterium]
MSYYPILVDLEDRKVVIVGGGNVAQRKIDTLLEYHADIYIIAKDLTPALQSYAKANRIQFLGPDLNESHLDGAFLVIAATDDMHLNHKVGEMAKQRGLLINAVDQPKDCSFIVPSVVKRGELVIAVSTSGKSPALAKKIRQSLSDQFGDEYAEFLDLMGRIRKDILAQGFSQEENSRVFHALVDSKALDAIAEKDWSLLTSILEKVLKNRFSREAVSNYIKG